MALFTADLATNIMLMATGGVAVDKIINGNAVDWPDIYNPFDDKGR
jgi:hypothetical protein